MTVSKPAHSTLKVEIHTGSEVPLLTGRYIDLDAVALDGETDYFAADARRKALLRAVEETGFRRKPLMAVSLLPVNELGLIYSEIEQPITCSKSKEAVKLLVAAEDVVDISHLKPRVGRSVLRCNGAFPAYVWFRAVNLLLHYKNETAGRVIPFPLETDPKASPDNPNPRTTLYHALRVTRPEFERYQELLKEAVDNDGPELGFYHASKYAYEVLFMRGYKEITDAVVGQTVTDILMMGRPVMHGLVIANHGPDDLDRELSVEHGIFS